MHIFDPQYIPGGEQPGWKLSDSRAKSTGTGHGSGSTAVGPGTHTTHTHAYALRKTIWLPEGTMYPTGSLLTYTEFFSI